MQLDLDGLPLTTASDGALGAYDAAVDSLLAGRTEVESHVRRALEADERLALGWVLLALHHRLGGRMADAATAMARAVALADSVSGREQGVIAFFSRFGHDARGAESVALAHLREHPRDRLVVMYVHFLYNLMYATVDRRARHHGLYRSLAPVWGDDWFLLGALAFAESEAGNHAEAHRLAVRAHDARPDAAPPAHALSHTMLETGAVDEGSAWLGDWLERWGRGSTQGCHLTWHHALFGLAAGDDAAVAARLDTILGYVGRSVGALTDGASLLWRLQLDGWPADTLPWSAISELPSPPGFSFGNLHRGLVLAGTGAVDELRSYAATLDDRTADACTALAEFSSGDHGGAAERLAGGEHEHVAIGGSRAQLEVLDDTLIAALARCGRTDEARQRLSARLASRASVRDERWLAELSS